MQELFFDKIQFLRFPSISDKLRLDQPKIITATRSTSFSESFQPTSKEKYQPGRENTLR